MCDAGRGSTGFEPACERGGEGRSSSAAGERAARSSPPDRSPPSGLRRHRDFQRLYREGRRGRSGPVTVLTARGWRGETRVGVVASRNVGGAVLRNRAKRRLRAAVRRLRLREGMDYVVIASPRVLTEDFAGLEAHVAEAARRAEREDR